MSIDNKHWITEVCEGAGIAFSFKMKAKVHEEQTPFQKLEIYETEEFGYLMLLDGFMMLTSRDNFLYHEMMSHPALFSHPDPKKVVIIGGGDCGTLREVLKHTTVELAHQIDIDERVTRLSEKYFPELCESNDDPRAKLDFIDGVAWMKTVAPGSIDVIIIDSTDPIGPGEGLFSTAFYQDCFKALSDHGIIVQQSESPLLHFETIIQPMYQKFAKAGFVDTQTFHFPQPCYPSGWWSATMAIKNGALDSFREQDARDKTFATRYYTSDLHKAAKVPPAFMKEKTC
ncbi:MAG: polyamine aminopropyltransferase [Gammaproteobacteria bacterium]